MFCRIQWRGKLYTFRYAPIWILLLTFVNAKGGRNSLGRSTLNLNGSYTDYRAGVRLEY